jgi:hypothetical protein
MFAGMASMTFLRVYWTLLLLPFLILPVHALGSGDSLRTEIEQIVGRANAKVGVALLGVEDSDTLTVHGNEKFPFEWEASCNRGICLECHG